MTILRKYYLIIKLLTFYNQNFPRFVNNIQPTCFNNSHIQNVIFYKDTNNFFKIQIFYIFIPVI